MTVTRVRPESGKVQTFQNCYLPGRDRVGGLRGLDCRWASPARPLSLPVHLYWASGMCRHCSGCWEHKAGRTDRIPLPQSFTC